MKHTLREAARVLGLLDESYVLERSGVTWNERFYVSGDPDDEGSFGPLDSAAEFATPGEAQRVASRSGFHMTPTERSDLEEGGNPFFSGRKRTNAEASARDSRSG